MFRRKEKKKKNGPMFVFREHNRERKTKTDRKSYEEARRGKKKPRNCFTVGILFSVYFVSTNVAIKRKISFFFFFFFFQFTGWDATCQELHPLLKIISCSILFSSSLFFYKLCNLWGKETKLRRKMQDQRKRGKWRGKPK